MEKIETLENISSDERESIFRSRAEEYLNTLNIQPFEPKDLAWARSEKEIEKCKMMIEKSKHKAALKARDLENKANENSTHKFRKNKVQKNSKKGKSKNLSSKKNSFSKKNQKRKNL